MKSFLWLTVGAIATLCLALKLEGQQVMAGKLNPGDRVRLTAPGLLVEQGLFVELSDGLVVVEEMDQVWRVPLAELQSFEAFQRSPFAGAWRGGLVGSLMGLGIGYLALQPSCDGRCATTASGLPLGGGDAIKGGLMGLGAGAAIGGILGMRWRRWKSLSP